MIDSGLRDKYGNPLISEIDITASTTSGGEVVLSSNSFSISAEGPLVLDVEDKKIKLSLNTDTTSAGSVAILDDNGKLPESVMPSISLVDIIKVETAETIDDILNRINNSTEKPEAKQGDIIIVLGGSLEGNTYMISSTKTIGTYVADDLLPIKIPNEAITTINFNEKVFTPTNGIINLGTGYINSISAAGPIIAEYHDDKQNIITLNARTATTSLTGVVRLSNSYLDTSTTTAATPYALNQLYRDSVVEITSNSTDPYQQDGIPLYVDRRNYNTVNILASTNTNFPQGPLIDTPYGPYELGHRLVTDYQVTDFLNHRVYNVEKTYGTADVLNTNSLGILTVIWTPYDIFDATERLVTPRIIDIILKGESQGLGLYDENKVVLPVLYEEATDNYSDRKAYIKFFESNADITTIYDGFFNDPEHKNKITIVMTNLQTI